MHDSHHQRQWTIRTEWGLHGAAAISAHADFAIVVDVLSFTTTLTVAIDAGIQVFPYRWNDESARDFASRHDATLAVDRPVACSSASAEDLVSLSPASVRAAANLTRIVLPSPNGSTIASLLAEGGATVVGACLRNPTAVARWLVSQTAGSMSGRCASGSRPVIAVIAAGERWPDGSLRPCVEDQWGAGAVIAALAGLGCDDQSPEASAACAAFCAARADVHSELLHCSSGQELADKGFADDVTIAAELDSSQSVPVLTAGRFVNGARQ